MQRRFWTGAACCVLLAVLALPAAAETVIIRATWGIPTRHVDVTQKVRSLVRGGRLDFVPSPDSLGIDPTPEVPKTLTLEYTVDGKRTSRTWSEHDRVLLENVAAPASGVEIAATQPEPGADQLPDLPVADPDAVERPEYQKRPKRLVRPLTSVTAMMVRESDDGMVVGVTGDIIAVVPPMSRQGKTASIGIMRGDGDEEMQVALEEAVRAVTLRYPVWEPGRIDLSFGEKFEGHGGPSAGTAFAILMLSALEGWTPDPDCALTGDITVDWKVRKVGAVAAKLRGAELDKCKLAAIPTDNAAAFDDMGVLYGQSSWWDIQVFTIATLQDAEAVVRKDRPAKLQEAIDLFAGVQEKLRAKGRAALYEPGVKETVEKVLALAPNDLSAKLVLAMTERKEPHQLTAAATLYKLSVIVLPYLDVVQSRRPPDRTSVPSAMTALMRQRVAALRPVADRELLPLINDFAGYAETLDLYVQRRASAKQLVARAQAYATRVQALSDQSDFWEKLEREGY